MKLMEYLDENGLKRKRLLLDDEENPERGINLDPPPLEEMDWSKIKMLLHNQLVNRKLIAYEDISKSNSGLNGAILSAFKPVIIAYYKELK